MNKMKRGKCDTCWKSFIWACPLLLHLPINIISCSAYEPTDVYLKEQELISKFLDDLHGHRGLRGIELINYIVSLEDKWEKEENE